MHRDLKLPEGVKLSNDAEPHLLLQSHGQDLLKESPEFSLSAFLVHERYLVYKSLRTGEPARKALMSSWAIVAGADQIINPAFLSVLPSDFCLRYLPKLPKADPLIPPVTIQAECLERERKEKLWSG